MHVLGLPVIFANKYGTNRLQVQRQTRVTRV